jgi:hypothetical protein
MKKQTLALAGLVAAALAACGGGSSPSSQAPVFAATSGSVDVTGTRWSSVKFGGGGYVPGLIYHPTNPSLLYARTDVGGAYRWDPATSTWVSITDSFSGAETFYSGGESLALDPNDDQRVYMTAGQYASDDSTGRLYISKDRGNSWTHVDLPFAIGSNNQGRAIGERMMVDPNNSSILFYGSRKAGLWKSTDYGQTWNQVTSLSTNKMNQDQINTYGWGNAAAGVEGILFDTNTHGGGGATQTIYTAVAPDYANASGMGFNLYKSTDGGATWSGVQTPVSGYYIPHMVRAKDGMIYVAFTQGMGPGANGAAALYKFDGTNWTLLKSYQPSQWLNFGIGGLSVSGSGATTRIALGVTNSWVTGRASRCCNCPMTAATRGAKSRRRCRIRRTAPASPAGWTTSRSIRPIQTTSCT